MPANFTYKPTTLFSGTGKIFRDEGNALDRTAFSRGYALYAFDLTPDLGEDDHFNLTKQGGVRLVLKCLQALTKNVTVIAYAEFQNVIEIDRYCNVIYDFAVRRKSQQRSSTDETEATRV